MDQVLMNVIKNAAEAIERDGTIEIAVRRDDERVTLVVSDTGCGLDEHVRGNLFKPFFTTKRRGQGLGLPTRSSLPPPARAFGSRFPSETRRRWRSGVR